MKKNNKATEKKISFIMSDTLLEKTFVITENVFLKNINKHFFKEIVINGIYFKNDNIKNFSIENFLKELEKCQIDFYKKDGYIKNISLIIGDNTFQGTSESLANKKILVNDFINSSFYIG